MRLVTFGNVQMLATAFTALLLLCASLPAAMATCVVVGRGMAVLVDLSPAAVAVAAVALLAVYALCLSRMPREEASG